VAKVILRGKSIAFEIRCPISTLSIIQTKNNKSKTHTKEAERNIKSIKLKTTKYYRKINETTVWSLKRPKLIHEKGEMKQAANIRKERGDTPQTLILKDNNTGYKFNKLNGIAKTL
jgi:hypothetical protein